jgi:hypothetical protein
MDIQDIQIKQLSYKQMKKLRKAGYDLTRIDPDAKAKQEYEGLVQDAMEFIVQMAYPEFADFLEDRPYSEILQLGRDTFRATYGTKAAAKNSPTSTAGR